MYLRAYLPIVVTSFNAWNNMAWTEAIVHPTEEAEGLRKLAVFGRRVVIGNPGPYRVNPRTNTRITRNRFLPRTICLSRLESHPTLIKRINRKRIPARFRQALISATASPVLSYIAGVAPSTSLSSCFPEYKYRQSCWALSEPAVLGNIKN